MNTKTSEIAAAEAALAAAGVTFAVVDTCPSPFCLWCGRVSLPTAA